jgi:hypothetical protein
MKLKELHSLMQVLQLEQQQHACVLVLYVMRSI